jgi:SAM-dependent methyltransferase
MPAPDPGQISTPAEPETYLRRYLAGAPAALALWRSIEARHFASVPMRRPLLDIGAGFGEFGRAFFDSPADVGLDISRRDLTICARAGVYRDLVQADARIMPFGSERFNTVMSVSVLEHIPEVASAFPETYRILRPGGMFVFSVPLADMDSYMLLPPLARRANMGGLADGYVRRVHRAFKHHNLHVPEWWLEHVRKNGFEVVEQRRIISRKATRMFDAGLPTALISQIGRISSGERAVWHPKPVLEAWARVLRGVVAEQERPGDGSNLFVVARRP